MLSLPPLAIAAIITFFGLAILAWSGDKLVDGASALAKRLNVSEVFIGIIIVGFGTSLPEVMATVSAARMGENEIALGNIIGSNIANVGFILAIALILTKSHKTMPKNKADYLIMMAIMCLFSLTLIIFGQANWISGLILMAGLCGYFIFALSQRDNGEGPPANTPENISLFLMGLMIIGGLIGLAFGADLLIKGATEIARTLGVTERIIGITLVAMGTSLPELAAAIAATRQGSLALSVGNILGSNAFNILAAAGISSFFTPLLMENFFSDIIIMLLFSLLLAPIFLKKKNLNLTRLGLLLLGCYCVYTLSLFLS